MMILMIMMDFLSLWQAALPSRISKSGLVQLVAVNIAVTLSLPVAAAKIQKSKGRRR